MASVRDLYDEFSSDIERIVSQVSTGGAASIPVVLAELMTQVVPSMMQVVGKFKRMSGDDKRKLIIDTITFSLKETFEILNDKIPKLKQAKWDESILSLLLAMTPPTIRLLIDVEKKKIMFNKKLSSCFCCL